MHVVACSTTSIVLIESRTALYAMKGTSSAEERRRKLKEIGKILHFLIINQKAVNLKLQFPCDGTCTYVLHLVNNAVLYLCTVRPLVAVMSSVQTHTTSHF